MSCGLAAQITINYAVSRTLQLTLGLVTPTHRGGRAPAITPMHFVVNTGHDSNSNGCRFTNNLALFPTRLPKQNHTGASTAVSAFVVDIASFIPHRI